MEIVTLSAATCTIGEKVLHPSVFDLVFLTYLCVDIDFRLISD